MLVTYYRVVRRPEPEPNFNVFYFLLAGLDPESRRYLALENPAESNMFMTPLTRTEDRVRAAAQWNNVCAAAATLGIDAGESASLWAALSAIFHLGCAGVKGIGSPGVNSPAKTQFLRPQAAQRAAQCLGTTLDELTR